MDEGGLPIGMTNHITVNRQGSGVLDVTLLRFPVSATGPQKTAGLAEFVRDNQIDRPEPTVAEFAFPLSVN